LSGSPSSRSYPAVAGTAHPGTGSLLHTAREHSAWQGTLVAVGGSSDQNIVGPVVGQPQDMTDAVVCMAVVQAAVVAAVVVVVVAAVVVDNVVARVC
jgi:hypothetical protein